MHRIEQTACELLTQGEVFLLAAIVRRQGVALRTVGSKMIITPEGRGIDTIDAGHSSRVGRFKPLPETAANSSS